MLSDNEMVLPNIIISEGVLKWFTFSCGGGGGWVRGIVTKILWDSHFGKCCQGGTGIQYDPSTGTGGIVEWPIDPLSEGNSESFEYILLLRATGSVLPYSGNTNNTFSSGPNQKSFNVFFKN